MVWLFPRRRSMPISSRHEQPAGLGPFVLISACSAHSGLQQWIEPVAAHGTYACQMVARGLGNRRGENKSIPMSVLHRSSWPYVRTQ